MKHNRGELIDKGDAMKEKIDRAVDFLEKEFPGHTKEEYLEAVEKGHINYFDNTDLFPNIPFQMTFHELFTLKSRGYLNRKSDFKNFFDKWK